MNPVTKAVGSNVHLASDKSAAVREAARMWAFPVSPRANWLSDQGLFGNCSRYARFCRNREGDHMQGFAVIDLETTGFAYTRNDRICEVAVVLLDADGSRQDAWTTLINSQRDRAV